MIRFNCFECHNDFQAAHFNLACVNINCPICETHLNIAQAITRVYGKTVGEQVTKIMDALVKVADRSRNTLLAPMVESAYARIVKLCEEAG